MNAAASSNFQDMLVAEIKLHQHVAQMDAVRRWVPYPFRNVKLKRQLSKLLPHGGGIQIGTRSGRQILIVCISHTLNLLDAAKESNPAQPFHEAGPKIPVLSENRPRHDQKQLVRRRHDQNSQGPKHPR